MMEALTVFQDLSPEPLFAERLDEMVTLFMDKIILPNPSGGFFGHGDFLADWTPTGEQLISYGHDLELVILLIQAARAAERVTPELLDVATQMGVTSSRGGYDSEKGGFWAEGELDGTRALRTATEDGKVWWTQFDAMMAMHALWALTGEEEHLGRLEGTLMWLEDCQMNKATGAHALSRAHCAGVLPQVNWGLSI